MEEPTASSETATRGKRGPKTKASPKAIAATLAYGAKAAEVWGATKRELQVVFGLTPGHFERLLEEHPKFKKELLAASQEANARVVQALFRRACGYRHVAWKIFNHEGRIITKRYVEHYPPETTACIFWLTNREKEDWKHRWELERAGPPGLPKEGEEMDTVEAARRIAFALTLANDTISNAKGGG